MSMNFSEVFTAITTERYNKVNLINCIVCLVLTVVIVGILNNFFAGIVICIFVYFLISGYLVIMSHNEAIDSKNVIPEINNIVETLKIGFKYLTGISTLMVIFSAPFFICFAIILANIINMVLSHGTMNSENFVYTSLIALLGIFIFGIASIILYFKFGIPAQLLFIQTLKLSDMFSFKKLVNYGKIISKDYWLYILYSIVISIIINVIVQTIMTPVCSIFMFKELMSSVNTESAAAVQDILQYIKQNAGLYIGCYILSVILQNIFILLFFPNLNGQIIRNALEKQ